MNNHSHKIRIFTVAYTRWLKGNSIFPKLWTYCEMKKPTPNLICIFDMSFLKMYFNINSLGFLGNEKGRMYSIIAVKTERKISLSVQSTAHSLPGIFVFILFSIHCASSELDSSQWILLTYRPNQNNQGRVIYSANRRPVVETRLILAEWAKISF